MNLGPGMPAIAPTGLTVFLGAFLLFLVQPIIAKLMLPRFGGSVAVWATCLVFFQAALLLGYALAHRLVSHPRSRWLQAAHLALLAGSLALLPLVPLPAWQAGTETGPAVQILLLLVLTIGLPFTLLSMTSPLLQAWIAASPSRANPYRLFAVSNLASLAALLAYPWLIEPWLRTATQARVWSAAYAAYVVLLALLSLRQPRPPAAAGPAAAADAGAPGWPRTLSWLTLAALGSYVLVAVTNHLTQNIPSFPMMWVLPLVIYLLSFTLSFDADRWYPPRAFRAAMLATLLLWAALLVWERTLNNLALQIGGFLAGLFVVCMVCHGELARSRPAPSQLTHFYLAVSAGGVVGGALVALAAPALLPGCFELEIGLVLLAALMLWRSRRGPHGWVAAAAAVTLLAIAAAAYRIHDTLTEVVDIERNFYGVVRIREYATDQPGQVERVLIHGRVMHGQQFMAPQRRRQPTSYYSEASGIGRLLTALNDRPIDVGAIGLGAGTIATYGKPGDRYRFYEIDDAIVAAAHRHFSFIADSPAAVDVQVGDGRLLLQQEAQRRFDVVVVDAFSGDSIPVHLLTREAVALYRDRLKPGGVIALHISNTHLELAPVVAAIAAELGLQSAFIVDPGVAGDVSTSASDWVLLAADRTILDLPAIARAAIALPRAPAGGAWTDDYSNIVQVMRFGRSRGIE
jgi:hypothetical protein